MNVVQDLFHLSKNMNLTWPDLLHLLILVPPAFPAELINLVCKPCPNLQHEMCRVWPVSTAWEALEEVAEEGTFYNWLLLEPLRPYFWAAAREFATASAKLKGVGVRQNAGAKNHHFPCMFTYFHVFSLSECSFWGQTHP